METSKLVSLIIANFKIAYPYYFKDLTEEEFIGLITLYQEYFTNFNASALIGAVKDIIRKSKFMPTISEIIEQYKKFSREYFIKLVKNSSLPDDEKGYLTSMVDWYSIHEEYPQEILNQINKLDCEMIARNKREALTHDNT